MTPINSDSTVLTSLSIMDTFYSYRPIENFRAKMPPPSLKIM